MLAPTVAPIAPTGAMLAPLYYVRHKRARRYLLRVDVDGRLRVTIPRGGSRREADAFAGKHIAWVEQQRARLPRHAPASDEPRDKQGDKQRDQQREEQRALRERAIRELPPRLNELAARHGLTVSRVSVRNQRSRWGSCGRDGHICLNWRLVLMPEWVSDYVLVHELMHVRRMDHSPAYWRLVAGACSDYRAARQWLRTHGPSLR
jgi:predicted metal-dependent hydrolase